MRCKNRQFITSKTIRAWSKLVGPSISTKDNKWYQIPDTRYQIPVQAQWIPSCTLFNAVWAPSITPSDTIRGGPKASGIYNKHRLTFFVRLSDRQKYENTSSSGAQKMLSVEFQVGWSAWSAWWARHNRHPHFLCETLWCLAVNKGGGGYGV